MDSSEDFPTQRVARLDIDPTKPLPAFMSKKSAMAPQARVRAVPGHETIPEEDEEESCWVPTQQPSQLPKARAKAQAQQRGPFQPLRVVKKTTIRNESQARGMLPRLSLPVCLNPDRAARRISRTLPQCWYGLPFLRSRVSAYAKKKGLTAYRSALSVAVDEEQTWRNICEDFLEESGVEILVRDVWKCNVPILAFFSNLEPGHVTRERQIRIQRFLAQLGYEKDCPLMWYLDKRESL